MQHKESFWWFVGGGSLGYTGLLLLLHGRNIRKPEHWVRAGYKAGRRGKDWKKPLQACVRVKTSGFRPIDPNQALEWCGSLVASGHAVGVEGKPFNMVVINTDEA